MRANACRKHAGNTDSETKKRWCNGGESTINDYEWEYTVAWQDGKYYLINLRADD